MKPCVRFFTHPPISHLAQELGSIFIGEFNAAEKAGFHVRSNSFKSFNLRPASQDVKG